MSKDTYETIFNNLPFVRSPGGDQELIIASRLTKVLMKLPEDVRKIALERCLFTSVHFCMAGVTQQAILPEKTLVDPHNFHLIIINEDLLGAFSDIELRRLGRKRLNRIEKARMELDRLNHLLAHEIAHAYMHETNYVPASYDIKDVEAEADRLASEWGFDEPN